jgi:hypothetical protein
VSVYCVPAWEGGRWDKQTVPLFRAHTMPTFEIPTGPANTQRSIAYHVPREEARRAKRAKRRVATAPKGSMTYDREKGGMTLEWANEEEFQAWLAADESEKAIELVVSHINQSDSPIWREWRELRCSHEFTGGKSDYQSKHQWERKIPSKKTGCRCRLVIKQYPHTEILLGRYADQHDHPLGDANLRFMRLSGKIRNFVMDMVYMGIEAKAIVSHN